MQGDRIRHILDLVKIIEKLVMQKMCSSSTWRGEWLKKYRDN